MLKMMHRVTKQFLLIAGASLFGLLLYYGVRKFLILSGIPVTDDKIWCNFYSINNRSVFVF
jgi:hypothetical protein